MNLTEKDLARDIGQFFDDPLGFVLYAFPWGSGELKEETGPDTWQIELLESVGRKVRDCEEGDEGAILNAVASGHGIGKSALVAWIILWAMSTRPHLNGVVTASTKTQLETKTWRELAIWHKRSINKHWFEWTATKIYQKDHPETWFCACIPWREENAEAFAGQHAQPHNVLVIYDEASAIADAIWEVSEGAMTTVGAMWFAFGNPTRNTGRFRDCWTRFAHRWATKQIDSRTCKMTNKKQLEQWVEDYGEDSDFVKVRVRGVFPSVGDKQLIDALMVEDAMRRINEDDVKAALVIGADIARFGSDQTCFTIRNGRKLLKIQSYRNLDTMQTSTHLCNLIDMYKPDMTFVDGVGIGGAVIDRCKQLGYNVYDVQSGGSPNDKRLYGNKRIELWIAMRDWLKTADIPRNDELFNDLIGPEYKFMGTTDKMILESKDDMKKRGIQSPDVADSLAMTFAAPVRRKDLRSMKPRFAESDYNPLEY